MGALDPNVTDDQLRSVFSKFGELVHVKIPQGKRCGFVQFANRYLIVIGSIFFPSLLQHISFFIIFVTWQYLQFLCGASIEYA